jgi:PTH1 family peptidyl-tRNA hydrolase
VVLLVGLGNPGREYEETRHNVGFLVADALVKGEGWGDYKPKFSGVWTRGDMGGHDGTSAAFPQRGQDMTTVVVLKPQTFMNLSGESVQPAAAFLKVSPGDIVVVHDELDLPWRDVRVKLGGGHAGHNGLRSIIQRLGTAEFVRVRVGIGRAPSGFKGDVADWVLSRFDAVERAELGDVVQRAVDAVKKVVKGGVQAAMNEVNGAGKR